MYSPVMKRTVGLIALAASHMAVAGPVTLGDFGPGAILETFESQGSSFSVPSVTFGGNTFASDGTVNVSTVNAPTVCNGTLCLSNNSASGYIDIILGTPVAKAGAVTGLATSAWGVSVGFFSQSDELLGTLTLSGLVSGLNAGFFGWQSESDLIGRIRINDLELNTFRLVIDNFITEPPNAVPIPAGIWLFGSAIVGAASLRGFRRGKAD